MKPEERRELEKLVEEWRRRAATANKSAAEDEFCAGVFAAMEDCAADLRATLDRLTDEQSEPTTEDEEVVPDEGPNHRNVTQGERLEECKRALTAKLRAMTGLDLSSGLPGAAMTAIDALIQQRIRLHRSPEPPDSTEPEDDLVERVARWLMDHHDPDGLTTYDLASSEPTEAWRNRAYDLLEWLHDTGILTTESETP